MTAEGSTANSSPTTEPEAQSPQPSAPRVVEPALPPFLVAVLAWLLPGAGHWLLGRRARAVVFCVLILTSFVLGAFLRGNLHSFHAGQPVLAILGTLGTMGVGLSYFVLRYAFGYHGDIEAPTFEYGTAFLISAGLMNLLLLLNLWDIAKGYEE